MKTKFKGGKPQKESFKKPVTKKKEDNDNDIVFPKGVVVFAPHKNAPDFVKAEIIINIDEFTDFIQDNEVCVEHEKYGTQLKLTLQESKGGVLYCKVNTFGK